MKNSSSGGVFVSTSCLPGTEPLEKRVDLLHRHGVTKIELGAGVTIEPDWLSRLNDLGNVLDSRYLIHNYFPPPEHSFVLNLASPDEQTRQQSIDFACHAVQLSAQLGAPFYSVHAGFITDPVAFGTTSFVFPAPKSESEVDEAMHRFVDSLNIVLASATEHNIMLLVENNVCTTDLRGKLLLQRAEEFETLFNLVSTDRLGILLDFGHLNVSAHTFGFSPADFATRLLAKVKAFHLHDNDGQADYHRPVTEVSWILPILKGTPKLASLPIVIESKFDSAQTLASHVVWLEEML